MKVEELAAGHRRAMTNSWCHGLIECVCGGEMAYWAT